MFDLLERKAIIISLIESMQNYGSWTGETHIQKCTYFLEELLKVPLEFNFILYKHGPFSFDLRDELTSLRVDNLIDFEPREPYGASFYPGRFAYKYKEKYSMIIETYSDQIDFVVEKLANKSVKELERIATALYVKQRYGELNENEVQEKIIELKPHVNKKDASQAVYDLYKYIHEVKCMFN